jgi:hypothetical protein
VNPEHWDVLPKDYTLFGIKFMNRFHGNYLRRGVDKVTDADGNTVDNVYHKEYVEQDEVVMVSTLDLNSVELQNTVRRGENSSPGSLSMKVHFEGDVGVVTGTEGDPYNISGTGQFKTDGDEWGGKARDVIYLDYTYTDTANNETHVVKDTLVVRDRAAVFEQFTVELK